MAIEIPISNRARQYGYIFWAKTMDPEVKKFLGKREKVDVWFEDSNIGTKNVDWKYRRISVGHRQTRRLSAKVSSFQLRFDKKGVLRINCK